MPTDTTTGGFMSDGREFLKHLAGTTTGIIFVNCGLLKAAASLKREVLVGRGCRTLAVFYMQLNSARYGADRNRSMKRI
jgi:hypothetical protein